MTKEADDLMRRRVVISSTLGNALEWFDFTVFGLFAGIISKLFFPSDDPATSLLQTFATFGIAFAARPVGGLVFGIYADKFGRKRALVVMIMMMAFGTGLLGFLPTYAQIGIAAPMLLLLARLIQGFSAGGEFGSASAMLIEFATPGRRGFYGSWQMVSQGLAFGFGAIMAYVLNTRLSPEHFAEYGWRVPFLLGILIGPIGFYLRRKIDESPDFKAYAASRPAKRETPLADVISQYPRELIAGFCLIASGTAINYIGAVFMPTYAASELKLLPADALAGLIAVSLCNAVIAPFAGALSDRIGRRVTILPALALYCALSWFFFSQLIREPSAAHLWQLQATGLLLGFLAGPMPAFMTEIFPVGMRSTGASLMYNLAVMLFGGLAPYWCTKLVELTGQKIAPLYYIFFAAAVGAIGLLQYRPRSEQTAIAGQRAAAE